MFALAFSGHCSGGWSVYGMVAVLTWGCWPSGGGLVGFGCVGWMWSGLVVRARRRRGGGRRPLAAMRRGRGRVPRRRQGVAAVLQREFGDGRLDWPPPERRRSAPSPAKSNGEILGQFVLSFGNR